MARTLFAIIILGTVAGFGQSRPPERYIVSTHGDVAPYIYARHQAKFAHPEDRIRRNWFSAMMDLQQVKRYKLDPRVKYVSKSQPLFPAESVRLFVDVWNAFVENITPDEGLRPPESYIVWLRPGVDPSYVYRRHQAKFAHPQDRIGRDWFSGMMDLHQVKRYKLDPRVREVSRNLIVYPVDARGHAVR